MPRHSIYIDPQHTSFTALIKPQWGYYSLTSGHDHLLINVYCLSMFSHHLKLCVCENISLVFYPKNLKNVATESASKVFNTNKEAIKTFLPY